jgi:chromosome partitioning protein
VGAEIEMINLENREEKMKEVISGLKDQYDFIIIDCSPSLGLITINALTAANAVIIPVQCEYFALEGLGKLLNTIKIIQTRLNPDLGIEGILLTMYDGRTRLASQVADEVRTHFGTKVLETVIPRNVRISEAPSYAQSVLTYDPSSPGALTYQEAAAQFAAIDPQNYPQT